jgi:hypothetical protein
LKEVYFFAFYALLELNVKNFIEGLLEKYIERHSKVEILTRRLLKIFCLERVITAYGKAQVKTKIWMQSRRRQKPTFESRTV